MSEPLAVHQAADEMKYHIKHIYRLPKSGRLEGRCFSGVWMIAHQEVERVKDLQGPGGRLPKEPKE